MWAEPQLKTSPDFRISDHDPDGATIAKESREWIARGSVPGAGTQWESMSRWALVDIRQLMASGKAAGGAPAAGAAANWGYFWPRDGAFLAVALDRTGHHEEARHLVDVLAGLPFDAAEGFDARYLLGGERVTLDPRGPQSDGCGWVLWALGSMSASSLPTSTAGLRSKCLNNIMRLTWSGWQLPPPSPDYWELHVTQTSLGTVAPMLAGLHATARAGTTLERPLAADMAKRLGAQVHSQMGPELERFGDHGGLDAAVAMLMPPFGPSDRRVTKQWLGYQKVALRSSGGLAPGAGWKNDGTSWTPETALVAYTAAASGQDRVATRWLDWLDDNRTPWGSLPEKVNRSGDPAGPAPLLWTAALVLLTLDALEAD
ncbi:glycoside hydrolase family 15 [Knoellia sp. S7-12]|uniref:glycoside hydrolase family 15 n=1 Tax=Knoellia sp. S7-12 TaxID=3126698 RepID=UPI0033669950